MSAARLNAVLIAILVGWGIADERALHGAAARGRLSFNRDVRPLLAETCFQCHGPDTAARKAGLRLDQRESALLGGKSKVPAIVPGNAAKSELLRRITAKDGDDRMPPPKSGKKLSSAQIATLRDWIQQGAKWEGHWAFEKPVWPAVPGSGESVISRSVISKSATTRSSHSPSPNTDSLITDSLITPIDAFVRARLKSAGLKPSPEADRRTLIRRLSLDLLGLPPSPEEVQAFANDAQAGAYERLVDRLLASPHFGERWARHWLDLARYADSDGYEKDSARPHAWLYRDWVIDAINRDLPFDQFTIEQLAGDLLPNATEAQRVATGFHRQTLINKEGGVDQEEFRCKATVDRAHTTAAVWLGLTLGCAECHTHKFDPITQREFYQFYAFFNNASDRDLSLPTAAEIAAHTGATNKWQARLDELTAKLAALGPEALAGASSDEETAGDDDANESKASKPAKPAATNAVAKLKAELQKHRKAKPVFNPTAAAVLEAEPRETFIHVRGDFLQKGERVQPGALAALHPFQARGEKADRLDLARWLVSPENPLTARVTVNHVWRHLFGRGLVATENDFGTRGEPPSHAELLDWLAITFSNPLSGRPQEPPTNSERGTRNSELDPILPASAATGLGWSRKALIRLIVTSATYRQSSAWRADMAERDPLNTLLARQGRFRVDAEVVRDVTLAMSGLLNGRIGGPSFKPALPADLARLNYANGLKWDAATGDERFRRSLYIHFQRTVPFPMLMAFDAPESNTTCTRRERSNSPLQALTLLNNEAFVECAQALGRRIVACSHDADARLRQGFELATGRPPTPAEFTRLQRFWTGQQERFQTDDAATCTAFARVLLNLDETITRE
jgi:mono/diheme cytochrome c family protein